MGTFTKSFASVGGYIASTKVRHISKKYLIQYSGANSRVQDVIDHLRESSIGGTYETSMPPGNVQEAISCLKIIMGEDGTDLGRKKVQQLHDNSNYFRQKLIDMGFQVSLLLYARILLEVIVMNDLFQVFGEKDSPVIPMMLYYPAKISAFSRECFRKNVSIEVTSIRTVLK